jgi:hypothetical protein
MIASSNIYITFVYPFGKTKTTASSMETSTNAANGIQRDRNQRRVRETEHDFESLFCNHFENILLYFLR